MDENRSGQGKNGTRTALWKTRHMSMGENNAIFSRMVYGAVEDVEMIGVSAQRRRAKSEKMQWTDWA